MSVLEMISKKVNAHNIDINSVSFGTLVASHNATMAVFVGSSLAYSALYEDITYQRDKPSENARKLLYIKLSKAYENMKNKKSYDAKNHKIEDISKIIDCAIYDTFINYNRDKKTDDRFYMLPKKTVSTIVKIPRITFDRKYYNTYHDFVSILQSGLSQVDRKAQKRLNNQ